MSTSIEPSNVICYFEKPSKPLGPQPEDQKTIDAREAKKATSLLTSDVKGTGKSVDGKTTDGINSTPLVQESPAVKPTVNAEGQSLGSLINVSA